MKIQWKELRKGFGFIHRKEAVVGEDTWRFEESPVTVGQYGRRIGWALYRNGKLVAGNAKGELCSYTALKKATDALKAAVAA